MNLWYSIQIDYLLMLQNFREITGGIFDNFFLFVTHGGETLTFAWIIAGIYWCINTQLALQIYCNLGFCTYISDLLKNLACVYRPWILDSNVKPVYEAMQRAHGYSFPSGHTQNAVSVWGTIAYWTKNKIFRTFLIILVLLIAFSRNYLGVHTSQDVVFSLFITTIAIFLMPRFFKWVDGAKNRDIIVYLSVIFMIVAALVFENFKSYPLDYVDGKLLVDPAAMRAVAFPKMGSVFGIFTGWFLNHRFIHFDAKMGTKIQKIVRFLVGFTIFALIYKFLPQILVEFLDKRIARFISAFSIIFFATVIYPLMVIAFRKYILKTENKEN